MSGEDKAISKPKKKRFKWTLRERKFITAYIKNSGNATKAYLVINPNAKHPRQYGYRMLQKVDISTNELLDEMGMTDAFLADILQNGLTSTKAVGLVAKIVDDFPTRHKYLDTAYKLKGTYPAEKHDVEERRTIVLKKKKEEKEDENEKN